MKIIHALFSDINNCIYCKKNHCIIKLIEGKSPCLRCDKFRGALNGNGCECEWDDYDFKTDVAIYDHIAEFERVTSFGEYNTKERIALWKEKNDEAHKLYDEQKRVTIWDLLREFSQILENDEYRAIENIGKSGSFSDEDLADYIDELTEAFLYSKKYNKWLHRFNRLVRGIENDTEIY